jgi:hypothetical protein
MERTLMRITSTILALLLAPLAAATAQSNTLPQTPAGKLLGAWIAAINTKDKAAIEAWLDKYWPAQKGLAQSMYDRANATGGYDVGSVLESSDMRIVALLRKRADTMAYNTITLRAESAEKVNGLVVGPGTARAADVAKPTLSAADIEAAKNTSPYRQYAAWLEAFNSGEKARVQKFLDESWPTGSITGQTSLIDRTGGFDLIAIEQATPTMLVGTMKEKKTDRIVRFTLALEASAPFRIDRFAMTPVQR